MLALGRGGRERDPIRAKPRIRQRTLSLTAPGDSRERVSQPKGQRTLGRAFVRADRDHGPVIRAGDSEGCRCVICGRSPATSPGLSLEVDHREPFSTGGADSLDNFQTLCQTCNRGKGNNAELNKALSADLDNLDPPRFRIRETTNIVFGLGAGGSLGVSTVRDSGGAKVVFDIAPG
jgi:5-methylcytosine-specific restriction endonuclease McrA